MKDVKLPPNWGYGLAWLLLLAVVYGLRPQIGTWLALITVLAVVAYMYRAKKGFFAKL